MTPIPFRVNPAFVTIGDAIELAIAHLRSNLTIWLVPAAIYTLVVGLVSWRFSEALFQRFTQYRYDPASANQMTQAFLDNLPGLIGVFLLLVVGGIALYWFAMAIAVGGLPGRRMTADQAIGGGLRTLALGLLYAVIAIAALFGFVVVGLLLARATIWLLLLVFPAMMFVFAYAAIRLAFALYAIFDGVGIIDSVRLSWAISHGAMLRILGWLLAITAISFGISIATALTGTAFGAVPLIGTLISTLLTTAFQFFTAIVLGVLYESQRMRLVFGTPGGAALPGGPVRQAQPAIDPGQTGDPLLPPPPPGW